MSNEVVRLLKQELSALISSLNAARGTVFERTTYPGRYPKLTDNPNIFSLAQIDASLANLSANIDKLNEYLADNRLAMASILDAAVGFAACDSIQKRINRLTDDRSRDEKTIKSLKEERESTVAFIEKIQAKINDYHDAIKVLDPSWESPANVAESLLY